MDAENLFWSRTGGLDVRQIARRFWTKVDKQGPNDCWLWIACTNKDGYGRFGIRRGYVEWAHRVAYFLSGQSVPSGLVLDHTCDVKRCVNPKHLQPSTHKHNILRGTGFSASNFRKTCCPQGHLLDGRRSNGRRYCMTCNRIEANRRRRILGVPERMPRGAYFGRVQVVSVLDC